MATRRRTTTTTTKKPSWPHLSRAYFWSILVTGSRSTRTWWWTRCSTGWRARKRWPRPCDVECTAATMAANTVTTTKKTMAAAADGSRTIACGPTAAYPARITRASWGWCGLVGSAWCTTARAVAADAAKMGHRDAVPSKVRKPRVWYPRISQVKVFSIFKEWAVLWGVKIFHKFSFYLYLYFEFIFRHSVKRKVCKEYRKSRIVG